MNRGFILVDNNVYFKTGEIYINANGFIFNTEFDDCFITQKNVRNQKKLIEFEILGEIQNEYENNNTTDKIKILNVYEDVEAYIESQVGYNMNSYVFWKLIWENGDVSNTFKEKHADRLNCEYLSNKINRSVFNVSIT